MSTHEEGSRRDELVRTATTVLARDGLGSTSIKDVARAAGVAPGLLHYYFASKEVLLREVVGRLDEDLIGALAQNVDHNLQPLERLVALFDSIADSAATRPEGWRLLIELHLAGVAAPMVRERTSQLWSRLGSVIDAQLRDALGPLPVYLASPRDLGEAVTAAIAGAAALHLGQRSRVEAAMRTLRTLLLSLVAATYLASGETPPMAELGGLMRRPVGEPAPV
jgi:AcrR family transcriptional regulator